MEHTTINSTEEMEELAAIPLSTDTGEKDEKKGKGKKKPTDKDIEAAVASVVLAEMKFWSERVVSLIGENHPNKGSFLRGVPYVIGAYMHLAREELKKVFSRRRRKIELRTVGLLGPLTAKRESIAVIFNRAREQVIRDLNEERKKEIEKAKKEINARYEKMISRARSADPPDGVIEISKEEAEIKQAYDDACRKVRVEEKKLLRVIETIEAEASDWDSKDRRKRRLEGSKESGDAE